MTRQARTGVVLAGGYSTRFGDGDKALAEIDGQPMLRRVVDRLADVVDTLVVSCRDEQLPEYRRLLDGAGSEKSIGFVTDPQPDRGPLVGIEASFRDLGSAYAAVVACDMPFVDPEFIDFLFDQAEGHDAAVPALDDGHRQPTQAVYHADRTARVAAERLATDKRSLHGLVERLDTVVIPPSTVANRTDQRSFLDCNSRTELARID